MEIHNTKAKEILAVNKAFYDAFATGDFLSIKRLWSRENEISVIHPGSAALHGQKAVMMSWAMIFENSGAHAIECVDARAYLVGDSAYVVCREVFPEGQLVATNIFITEEGAWRMVHHQAGPNQAAVASVSGSVH